MKLPKLIRLPFGAWFVARNDMLGAKLREGSFENQERAFVERILRPGMVVLDIGAHHGYYSLLASKRVGPHGRVISFEPSSRERRALRLHLMLNFCWNVSVEPVALGNEERETDFYLVDGLQTGWNSLRPPPLPTGMLRATRVRMARLDDCLRRRKIERVDFIKLDAEGGELDILSGATQLLEGRPRPVILAEVQDTRTGSWGYPASEIVAVLERVGYAWFQFSSAGQLVPLEPACKRFHLNLVAVPAEDLESPLPRMEPQNG
jgi:FkbM family methyltransferase